MISITKPTPSTLRLLLTIKPNARTTAVVAIDPATCITLRIHAPPRDGAANDEVVRFVTKTLGLRKSDGRVVSGAKSREKVVVVDGAAGVDVDKAVGLFAALVEE
ncbi:hypothetical protein BZA05DRAFT_473187 [Tricharina praecox]|uniref:uncharacterized protein n=1 Tax=Tricharina praecox TaxID=43433 RepID=UPI00222102BA|nr:uncharacterized protein BZA05DRAFT_473187 [Tricharina praecox]KAI5853823.1 hypothetical protein BZA05DRAFT_473187 [Tricharina praecox]